MGGEQSKSSDVVIEAFGYTIVEAVRSLRALLLARHNTPMFQDHQGFYYIEHRQRKFYVQHQKIELGDYLLCRAYVRVLP